MTQQSPKFIKRILVSTPNNECNLFDSILTINKYAKDLAIYTNKKANLMCNPKALSDRIEAYMLLDYNEILKLHKQIFPEAHI